MYTLTNNCLRNNANHFSATKRASPGQLARATGLLDRVRASNTGPVTASIRGEDLEDVYRALEKLTESEREVIVLHYLEQLPVTEVAAIVGLSPSAVRRCLSRCCQKVGSTLDR
jgi:RNA polymerase sigma-70 factor (ECF subfamily)